MNAFATESYHEIGRIQRKVAAMKAERSAMAASNPSVVPSRYWADFCSFFDYMTDLAPRAFTKLRLHTYHLTGDHYQTYYFGNREAFLDYWGPWLATEGLPPAHVLSEPDDGIGFRLDDGRFVSQDVARFQRSVSTLSRRGILDDLARARETPGIIEIGAGYGGLALHLARIVPNCRYTIVDLPETLLLSAAYLVLNAPERRVAVYDPEDPSTSAELAGADFALVPGYRLDLLDGSKFDLAINIAAMQEMRPDQVIRYLDFLASACRGTFYSCNRDRQTRNDELPGLFELIRSRFDLTEATPLSRRPTSRKARLRSMLRGVARGLGLVESAAANADPFPFVEHLGRVRVPRP